MSVAERVREAGIYPELAGARVLITGIGPTCGVDLARAFADHGCRLILQIPDPCPETDALLGILAETALDVHVHHDPITSAEDALRFAQLSAKTYGGLDVVVNLISIEREDLKSVSSLEDIERLITYRMQAAARGTGVAANRMGLMWANGSILNVLRMATPRSASEAALVGIARTALAALTASESRRWAGQGVRVNAVAPHVVIGPQPRLGDDLIRSEPEIAGAALFLASDEGRSMTGYVLDCEPAAN